MRNYAPIFSALTERQRDVLARLAMDDAAALVDKATVAELVERGLIWEALDETDNVSAMFMPHPVHIAWCIWASERLTAEDLANADEDASAFLARAEAEAAPPPAPPAAAEVPRRRGRGRGRPRNRRKATP